MSKWNFFFSRANPLRSIQEPKQKYKYDKDVRGHVSGDVNQNNNEHGHELLKEHMNKDSEISNERP